MQVLVRLLFNHLRVLQTVDQLQLFLLHTLDFVLMGLLVRCFSLQAFVHLLLHALLPIIEVLLSLLLCLRLLLFDHVLDLVRFLHFSVFLLQPCLLRHVFVHFRFVRSLLCRMSRHCFVLLHTMVDFVLHHQVLARPLLLLLEFGLLTL